MQTCVANFGLGIAEGNQKFICNDFHNKFTVKDSGSLLFVVAVVFFFLFSSNVL